MKAPKLRCTRRTLVLGAALGVAAAVPPPSWRPRTRAGGPRSPRRSMGPHAKHHTKIPFTVTGGAVRNFGVCGRKGACTLAGDEACSLAGLATSHRDA